MPSAEQPAREPWGRLPGESEEAHEALTVYLWMDRRRTLGAVVKRLGRSYSTVSKWFRIWQWRERADAWDSRHSATSPEAGGDSGETVPFDWYDDTPPKRWGYNTVRCPHAVDVALLRLVDGRGSLYENLSVITGLSVDSMKARVRRARHGLTDEERAEATEEIAGLSLADLEPDEVRALERMYGMSKDPEVRAFLGQINACTRKRPDARGESVTPRGRRRRSA